MAKKKAKAVKAAKKPVKACKLEAPDAKHPVSQATRLPLLIVEGGARECEARRIGKRLDAVIRLDVDLARLRKRIPNRRTHARIVELTRRRKALLDECVAIRKGT